MRRAARGPARTSCRSSTSTRRSRALPRPGRAGEGRPPARTRGADRRRARRPARRDAVREAVAAHALDVRDRGPRARRRRRSRLQPDAALGQREPVADVARNLERWVDAVVIRTFSQRLLEEFAAAAPQLHVINALTDDEHPCQALADCLTLRERWGTLPRPDDRLRRRRQQRRDLARARRGDARHHVHVASPEGYQLPDAAVQQATQRRPPRRAAAAVHRRRRRGGRRRRGLHRRLDVDGPGSRSRRPPRRSSRPIR